MTVIIVVSDDHWGARAEQIAVAHPSVVVTVDRSGGLGRSLRLVLRRSIPFRAAITMWMAQRRWPSTRPISSLAVKNNSELRACAHKNNARDIVLFRAGLIISDKTLESFYVRNIHCAKLAGYGGLAALYRALRDRFYQQEATLHLVTDRIDEGDILDIEPFELVAKATYAENETFAYEAGLRLLARTLISLTQGDNPEHWRE